jgi:hypothetical protein
MITIDKAFGLEGVVSNICMRHIANGGTFAVLGRINRRGTSNRDSPPLCGNRFDTSYLPFAKGHLIALELGGSDNEYNVVPQFEDWQGKLNGEWRQMESALNKSEYEGCLMLVEVAYGRTGAVEDHDAAWAAFAANRLRDWADPRIPNGFRVRVWADPLDPSSILEDARFNTEVSRLDSVVCKFDQRFNLGVKMPEPDRSMYINQMALNIAEIKHDDEVARQPARAPSMISWLLTPEAIPFVRAELGKVAGVEAPEAANQQAYPIMFAYQAGVTPSKIGKKVKLLKKAKFKVADDDLLGIPPPKKKMKP